MENKSRLEFLINKFNVCDITNEKLVDELHSEMMESGYQDVGVIEGRSVMAYVFTMSTVKVNRSGEDLIKKTNKIFISREVFDSMVHSDPTKNKTNTQWMLNIFSNLIKDGNLEEAIRFVDEDLPQAEEYLQIFEGNKRKNKFKEYCKLSYVLLNVSDPTNINQYSSLSQLYDAVDPFIERDASEIEKTLNKFVEMGQAEIPVRDRKFTVFIPKTTEASVIFDKFASWCTAKAGNTMFNSYTKNNLRPDGKKSKIYIVINNDFFKGGTNVLDNEMIYQIHFETKQVKNKNQSNTADFYLNVISQSEGVANFFNSELTTMAKEKFKIDNNVYLDYLIKFGWTQALFDLMLDVTPVIKLINREIPKLANMTKFTELRQLIICDSKLHDLHPSIGKLKHLESLALPNNKIIALPKEIGNLKNLVFINLLGNPLSEIPDEIKYLDSTNGGSLVRIAVSEKDIGAKNYKKIRDLLPSVKM
jgi:hypothetical protein